MTTAHNNQPNLCGIDGERIGEDARLSGNAGGWYSIAPGAVIVSRVVPAFPNKSKDVFHFKYGFPI